MAVVEMPRRDLEQLVGRRLTDEDYKNRIPMIGCPLEKADQRTVWYEVSPNRPDMYSVEGFARAVRNFLGVSKSAETYKTAPGKVLLVNRGVRSRPYIVAAAVRNVKLKEEFLLSLLQLQEKLHETLGRKRKKVAIGVHDLDAVKPPFTYKEALPSAIAFVPLDGKEKMSLRQITERHPKGKEYAHIVAREGKWPVLVDANGDVLSFPPIINGECTRLTKKTKNLFIDITGTSLLAVSQALHIIAAAAADRGGIVETVQIQERSGKRTSLVSAPMRMKLDPGYANRLLDTSFSKADIRALLARMRLGYDGTHVLVPPYRTDIMHPIDVVEDIAIAHGYARFEPRVPRVATIARRDQLKEFTSFLRDIALGLGMQETVTLILTNEDDEFRKMNVPREDVCATQNPVTVECTMCRKSLLPSLVKVLAQNRHRDYPQHLFEIGDAVVHDRREETNARAARRLTCIISKTEVGYEEIAAMLSAVMANLGVEYSLRRAEHGSFLEGRCASVLAGSTPLGIIGEIHPQVLENWKLIMPAAAFEIDVDEVFRLMQKQND